MNKALVTIGITSYREGQYLRECWESVLAQTDGRWEAVMILDGNADPETKKVFKSLSHPRLRKFEFSENCGPYPARKKAIQDAQTDWYVQLDADDILPHGAVDAILTAIEMQPKVDFVFGDCVYFGQGEARIHSITYFNTDALVRGLLPVITGVSPFRISAYTDVGGFASELSQGGADWDFWIGMAEKNKIGVRVAGPIYQRRERPHSVSSSWQTRRADVALTIIKRHPDFFAVNNRKDQCLYHAYLKMAQAFRRQGERFKAGDAARQALVYGESTSSLVEMIRESEMQCWRYKARMLARSVGR